MVIKKEFKILARAIIEQQQDGQLNPDRMNELEEIAGVRCEFCRGFIEENENE